MFERAKDNEFGYPFVLTSFEITKIALNHIRSGRLKIVEKSFNANLQTFNIYYARLFQKFHTLWTANDHPIQDFESILKLIQ